MSVDIRISHALKKYGDNVIIPDLSVNINPGEFFTLLGPSGCGKTTLLRMIAGFNSIEGGDFYFGDKRINDLDPSKRNIGMVFQNYAIFPHYTVRKNVEFGLKNRHLPKEEIRESTDKFLKLMQIDALADRLPDRLSGGQQQRVALARALCISPDVLLMDEPLSNLDAKLRVEMRTVIKNIQHDVGITCVYVTHDQEEAMAVSDRIAVMNAGVIGKAYLYIDDYKAEMKTVAPEYFRDQEVQISIRPEELLLNRDSSAYGMKGTVQDAVFLGLNTHYFVKLDSGEDVEIIQESSIEETLSKGARISLTVNTDKVNLFLADGSRNILTGVRNDLEA